MIANVAQVTMNFMPVHKEAVSASAANSPAPESLSPGVNAFTSDFVEASGNGMNDLLAAARRHARQQFIVRWPAIRLGKRRR